MTSLRLLASLSFFGVALSLAPVSAAKLAPLPIAITPPGSVLRERFHDAVARGLQQGAPAGISVLSGGDVRAQLSGDLASCSGTGCATPAARALSVDRLVVTEIAVTGKNYSISLRVVDPSGTETSRTADRCDICSVREADDAVARAAARLAAMVVIAPAEAPKPVVALRPMEPVAPLKPPTPIEVPKPTPVEAPRPPTSPPPAVTLRPMEPATPVAPTPVPAAALTDKGAESSDAGKGYRVGWITSLAVGGGLVVASIPFFAYLAREGSVTCADMNRTTCPTVYTGNRAPAIGLLASGLVVGAGGFTAFYLLERSARRESTKPKVALSFQPGGAQMVLGGTF